MTTNLLSVIEQLVPCPFCGAGTTEIKENGKMWTGMKYSDPVSVSVQHWCEPVNGQPSRMIERIGRDTDAVIAAWNQRPALAAGKQALEQAQGWSNPQWYALSEGASAIRKLIDCGLWSEQAEKYAKTLDGIRATHPQATEPAPAAPVVDGLSIERAARKLAERFDYPWVYMPDQGCETLRQHAQAVLDAALHPTQPKGE